VTLSLTDGLLSLGIEAGVLPLTTTQTGPIRFIIVGVALMLLVIFRPQGIFGKKKDLHFA
jgi:ABC-type branched-subunit amino acid transport system permease subunit